MVKGIKRMILLSGGNRKDPEYDDRRMDRRYDDRHDGDYNRNYDRIDDRRTYRTNIENTRIYPPRPYPPYYYGEERMPYMPPENRGRERYGGDEMNEIGFTAMHHDKGGEGRGQEMEYGYGGIIEGGKHKRKMEKMDRETAKEWTEKMKNADGTKGPHWDFDQCKQAMTQRGVDCDPMEFFVTMNMMYSDYCNVAKMLNINTVDFYVYMAKAFLDDDDAVENKLMEYYESVVK